MERGHWLKTDDGKDIYIVDYPTLICPEKVYTEKELAKFDECRDFIRNFIRENHIEVIANGKKLF